MPWHPWRLSTTMKNLECGPRHMMKPPGCYYDVGLERHLHSTDRSQTWAGRCTSGRAGFKKMVQPADREPHPGCQQHLRRAMSTRLLTPKMAERWESSQAAWSLGSCLHSAASARHSYDSRGLGQAPAPAGQAFLATGPLPCSKRAMRCWCAWCLQAAKTTRSPR